MRILIVDDEVQLLDLLKRSLSNQGHDIVTAQNGLEAQRALQDSDFDIVISDFVMPSLDGAELLGWLERQEKRPYVAITSGFFNESFPEYFKKLGADAVVSKPLDSKTLLQIIEDSRRHPSGQEATRARNPMAQDCLTFGSPIAHSEKSRLSSPLDWILHNVRGVSSAFLIESATGNLLQEARIQPNAHPDSLGILQTSLISSLERLLGALKVSPRTLDDLFLVTENHFVLCKFLKEYGSLVVVLLEKDTNLGLARLIMSRFSFSDSLHTMVDPS